MKFQLKDKKHAQSVRDYLSTSNILFEEKVKKERVKLSAEEKKAKRDARTPEQVQKIADRVKKMQEGRKAKKLLTSSKSDTKLVHENKKVKSVENIEKESSEKLIQPNVPLLTKKEKKLRKPRAKKTTE